MTKVELEKIMKDNCILSCEVENAIQFVEDLLEFQAKEIESSESYATNCIRRLKDATREVWNLQGYVENVLEEE